MKLLIITQKIDIDDDILGFFHRWVEKFAENLEKVYVVCLCEGKHNLPQNVQVYSLGKEKGYSKIRQLWRLEKFVFQNIKNVDGIFVHMCPIYAIAVCVLAKIFKKKIYLWHNHQIGILITRFAVKIVDKVFYTSPFSFAAGFKKSSIMPAGIDTGIFKKDSKIQKNNNSFLFLGRISKVKNFDVLIKSVKLLDEQKIQFLLNVVGEPGEKDKTYFGKIEKITKNLQINEKIRFLGKVPNYKTPAVYNQNQIFINLTPSGSFDKTILEAMACETLVAVSNKSFKGILPDELIFEEKNAEDLSGKIIHIFEMPDETKKELAFKLRDYVVKNHDIDILIKKLICEFQTT